MVALVGESGCGKTTTAQAVLRLVQTESGSVRFDGIDVTTLASERAAPAPPRGCRSSTRIRTSRSTPASACRATVAEPLADPRRSARAPSGACAVARCARARRARAAGALRRPLPARALRRPAAAGRDRGEPRARAGAARRRRARLDARRLGPRRHPRDPRRAARQRARASS